MKQEKNILMTKTNYIKIKHLKNSWKQEKQITKKIDKNTYSRIVSDDTLKWFRRIGSSQYVQRSYTCAGYVITYLSSTSPDKTNKSIREFKFI
jgi:hypothetical protein